MESILVSVKKLLGIAEECTDFDADIIMYINMALFALVQMGVGPAKSTIVMRFGMLKSCCLRISLARSPRIRCVGYG